MVSFANESCVTSSSDMSGTRQNRNGPSQNGFRFQRWEIGIFRQQVMCYEFFQHVRHTSEQKWTFTDWLPEARSVFLIGDFHEFPDTPIVVAFSSLANVKPSSFAYLVSHSGRCRKAFRDWKEQRRAQHVTDQYATIIAPYGHGLFNLSPH